MKRALDNGIKSSGFSASLYIHIPFCDSLCDYCDFYSININNVNSDYIDLFLEALIKDIKEQIEFFQIKNIHTVYIGGGTPSALGRKIIVLLDALNEIPRFSPVEFSIEANPESLTEDFLSVLRGNGVNRLSLGLQTFHERSRLTVNRKGAAVLEDRLALSAGVFHGMLSVDIITGLPYQNNDTVLDDIKRVLLYDPVHVSLYSLCVEGGTPLEDKIKTKNVILPDNDTHDSLWLTGCEALLKAGFEHYEVSNFARAGRQCLHNVRYWQMKSWLGAGPAASGTIVNENAGTAGRLSYKSDVNEYIKAVNSHLLTRKLERLTKDCKNLSACNKAIESINSKDDALIYEDLGKNVLLRECLLMGYRHKNGPDRRLFKRRFGVKIEDSIPMTLKKWEAKNKMLFLNSFLHDAFSELDEAF